MGKMVPLEDLPPEIRSSIRPGTPSFKAYALQLEKDYGLPLGSLSAANFEAAPDTDALWLLQSAARDSAKNPPVVASPIKSASASAPAALVTPDPSEGEGTLQFGSLDTGIKLPQGVNRALAGVGKSVSDTWLGLKQATGNASQDEVDEAHQRDVPLMNTPEGFLGNVAGTVSQAALPATGALKGAQAATLSAKAAPALLRGAAAVASNPLTQGAIVGGALGATQPVLTGDARGFNALVDAGTGAAGTGVTLGLAAAARPAKEAASRAVAALADRADELGIPLRAAQVSPNKWLDWAQAGLDRLPFGTGKKLSAAQQSAFDRALSRTMGEDTEDALTALAQSRARNSAFYDDIKSKYDLQLEPWHVDHMKDAWDDFLKSDISPNKQHSTTLRKLARSIVESADEDGKITGEAYKAMRSRLSKLETSGEAANDPAYAAVLQRYKYTLDSAFKSGLPPEQAAALTLADKQWANMRTLEKIAPKDSSGNFDFHRLAPLLAQRGAANATNRAGFLYGQGDQTLPDLARIGTQFLDRGPQPYSKDLIKRIGEKAIPMGTAGAGLYALNHDKEHPFLSAAGQAAGLALASRGLSGAANSRWFERGVPAVRKWAERATMGGLGQVGTAAQDAWGGGLALPVIEEGQTP